MATDRGSSSSFDLEKWDKKEFDWTNKCFYFIPVLNIFGISIGLGGKLEKLNREVKENGYKVLNPRVLIKHSSFGGRAMIEVEKQDKYDAQVAHYDTPLRVNTAVYSGPREKMGSSIKKLNERVAAQHGMAPREMYHMYVPEGQQFRTILFAFT